MTWFKKGAGIFMLTVFNRRELTITFSKEEQAKICAVLDENKIKFQLKIINRNRLVMPDARGSEGNDRNIEYVFYVHKLYLLNAREAIAKLGINWSV